MSGARSGDVVRGASRPKAAGRFGRIPLARLYLRQATVNLLISVLAASMTVLVSWDRIPFRLELLWGALFGAFLVMSVRKRLRGRSRTLTEARAERLLTKAPISAAFTGLFWGVTALFLPFLDGSRELAVSMTALGLCVAATSTLAAVPRAAQTFVIVTILPYILFFVSRASLGDYVIAALASALFAVLLFSSSMNHRSIITELRTRDLAKRAQNQLDEAQQLWGELSRTAEAFALYDGKYRLLLWNDAYRRLLGVAEGALQPGVSWHAIEAADKVSLPEARLFSGTHQVQPITGMVIKVHDRWYRSHAEQLSSQRTAIGHVDITELKEHERELLTLQGDLLAARDRAEAANKAKSQFLAKMSHELRTPLNAVIGFADLMLQDHERGRHDAQRHANYARIISDSGQHLLAIVDDILDLARIEEGRTELIESDADLVEIVRDCLRTIKGNAGTESLSFVEHSPVGAILVRCDVRLTRQAVLNLLSNAIKFTARPGRIDVEIAHEEDGGAAIEVRDDGIGIAPQMLEHVQEPFIQAERNETRKYGGAGLGLPLTRQFMELHGGRLMLTSRQHEGTTAKLMFPAGRVITAPQMRSSDNAA